MLISKYFVYDIFKYKNKIRAIVWHVKIDEETKESKFESEYTVSVDTETWEAYCTCIGFQMRKTICSHLKALFDDDKYKEICKTCVNR